MTDWAEAIKSRYQRELHDFLSNPGELHLLSAYELGREALNVGLGVIDMANIHHQALRALSLEMNNGLSLQPEKLGAIAVFFIECLTPFEMVHRGREEANAALRKLNETLEEEAKRIAQLLHDEGGQLLATAYLELAVAERDLPAMREYALRLRANFDHIREHLRQISHELHPTMLDDLGLVPALSFLAEGFTGRTGIPVQLEGGIDGRLSRSVESTLYRIVQEALANVSRHAQARHVVVSLSSDAANVVCNVQDDGAGFDAKAFATGRKYNALGLAGIQERLALLDGTVTIESEPGHGTRLRATIPLSH